MSVLVKGMKMPESCRDCPLKCDDGFYYFFCGVTKEECAFAERRDDCPLVPVPPHGRLIDADKITEHKYATIPPHRKEYADGKPKSSEEIIAFKFGWNYAIDAIVENAPTVIPASDEDTNVLSKEEGET